MSERGVKEGSRSSPLMIALVAGVCSGIASTAVLRLVNDEPAGAQAPSSRRQDGVADELVAIQQEIAALRQQIDLLRLPTSAVDRSADATPVPTSLAAEAQLVALNVAVADLGKRLDASLPPQIPPPGPRDDARRAALEPFFIKEASPSRDSYLYFGETDLLKSFGPPDRISASPLGPLWMYVEADSAEGTRAQIVSFVFAGGRVIDVLRD